MDAWEATKLAFYSEVDKAIDAQQFQASDSSLETPLNEDASSAAGRKHRKDKVKQAAWARKNEQKEFIRRYFNRNWFTAFWIRKQLFF